MKFKVENPFFVVFQWVQFWSVCLSLDCTGTFFQLYVKLYFFKIRIHGYRKSFASLEWKEKLKVNSVSLTLTF